MHITGEKNGPPVKVGVAVTGGYIHTSTHCVNDEEAYFYI